MRFLIALIPLLTFANLSNNTFYFNRLINDKTTSAIRASNTTWFTYEPGENPLRSLSDNELKYMISMPGIDFDAYKAELKGMMDFQTTNFNFSDNPGVDIDTPLKAIVLPTNFDWRDTAQGKRCTPAVLNQGSCGACYAFATAATFSSRYCSMIPGNTAVNFSPQDILACNVQTEACDGGILDLAFDYVEKYGLTTLSCQPYAEEKTKFPQTQSQKCQSTRCTTGETISKKFCKKGTSVIVFGKDKIKYEIYNWGPVATFMTMYGDLVEYKGGIYSHKTGVQEGGHAVVLMGWGIENGVEYWVAMNSWGSSWGEKGYFRIDMNDQYSGIGDTGYYCIPEIP